MAQNKILSVARLTAPSVITITYLASVLTGKVMLGSMALSSLFGINFLIEVICQLSGKRDDLNFRTIGNIAMKCLIALSLVLICLIIGKVFISSSTILNITNSVLVLTVNIGLTHILCSQKNNKVPTGSTQHTPTAQPQDKNLVKKFGSTTDLGNSIIVAQGPGATPNKATDTSSDRGSSLGSPWLAGNNDNTC